MPRIYIRKCDYMVLRTAKKGSVTIEAAVVLPLAVIAVLTMILFVFYMCDVITVRAKAEAYTMKDGDISEIEKDFKEKVTREVLVCNPSDISVSKSNNTVTVDIKLSFSLPFFGISKEDEIRENYEVENKRKYIDKIKAAKELVKGDNQNGD